MRLNATDECILNFINLGYKEEKQSDSILWILMIILGICTCYMCKSTYPLITAFLIILYVVNIAIKAFATIKRHSRLYLEDGLLFTSYSFSLQAITGYLFYLLSGHRLLSMFIVCIVNTVEILLIFLYTIARIRKNAYAPESMKRNRNARFAFFGFGGAFLGWSMTRQILHGIEGVSQFPMYSVFSATTLILALLLNFGLVSLLKFYYYIKFKDKYNLLQ